MYVHLLMCFNGSSLLFCFFVLFECDVIIIEQVKKGKPRTFRPAAALTPVRRSTRVADRPTVSYKEVRILAFE